jgi:hypothetical protein
VHGPLDGGQARGRRHGDRRRGQELRGRNVVV